MFKTVFFYKLYAPTYRKALSNAALHFAHPDRAAVEAWQTERFNYVWRDAYENVPFYAAWKRKHRLPDAISALSELDAWPVLHKQELFDRADLLTRKEKATTSVITSGSTGVPLKLPAWHNSEAKADMWTGRAQYGIFPEMKTFLIWGHQHLYGTGLRRVKNIALRRLKDHLLGYKRVSAYDTSAPAMRKAYDTYQRFRPEFVIGYSAAVLAFVRINKSHSVNPPRTILCTAGPLSDKEKEEISGFFHAPVCMEYGSVECGVMAYTEPERDRYNVFWHSHLIQGMADATGMLRNIVTNLWPCYIPLIRYDIGDYIEVDEAQSLTSILQIWRIAGRPSEMVQLPDGTSFFAMLIEACVEQIDGIVSHQLLVHKDHL